MSDGQIAALQKALKAVLEAARFDGVDIDRLCETAVSDLQSSVGPGWEKGMGIDLAIAEIAKAKKAMLPDRGVRRSTI
jgi:hypothetical protein